jgi:Family of unknown function (DUF6338)
VGNLPHRPSAGADGLGSRLLDRGLEAWVRIKLTDGSWVGGAYTERVPRSYASRYVDRRDLYLAWMAPLDQTTGEFESDPVGEPRLQKASLIRWDQIAYCVIEEWPPIRSKT